MNRKKNRMVWSGMLALALVFAVLVLAAGLSACDSPNDFPRGREGEKEPGGTKAPGFDMSEIGDYLSKATGGGGTTNPVPLPVSLDLPSDWPDLLEAIHTAGKYVALDLSACTMSGMKEFDPSTEDSSGKDKIVSLVLPDAATSVKGTTDYKNPTFKNFSNLTSVSGDNIETVGDYAFYYDCKQLKTVSLPAAITIGTHAFEDCDNLASVSLPEAITIGTYAFYRCTQLASVDLSKATDIGEGAFIFCTNLASVDLPEAITIGRNAFYYCANLASVDLPKATDIGRGAFTFCDNLASVDLPEAITIGSSAFDTCTQLASVDLPKATDIGERAFSNTGNTDLTVTLGSTVPTLVDGMFFYDVTDAKTVTVKVPNVAAWNSQTGTFTGDNAEVKWGNGLRGGGWTSEKKFVNSANIKSSITVTVERIE